MPQKRRFTAFWPDERSPKRVQRPVPDRTQRPKVGRAARTPRRAASPCGARTGGHRAARRGPAPSVGHGERAGLLHRTVRRRRHGLVDKRAAGRGLLPSRPPEHAGRRRSAGQDRRRARRRAGPPGGLRREAPDLRAIGMEPEARGRAGGDPYRAAIAGRRHAHQSERPGNAGCLSPHDRRRGARERGTHRPAAPTTRPARCPPSPQPTV
jgi:hypothetical protein